MNGAGLYQVGNGTRSLQALGLAEDLARQAYPIRTQAFYNQQGARLAEIDVARFWAGCGPCVGSAHAALHPLLVERAGDLPARHGLTIAALKQRAKGVIVRLSDGSVEDYDFVIAQFELALADPRLSRWWLQRASAWLSREADLSGP